MNKKLHPKVEKILDVSKSLKGKTLTGQEPNQVEIYTKVAAANSTVTNGPNFHSNYDFIAKR